MYHPKAWPMGEIDLGDGTVMLIPQPIVAEQLPPVGPLEDFYVTSVITPAPAPRSHAKRRKDPTWAVLCILVGAFLSVAAGVFLTVLGAMT